MLKEYKLYKGKVIVRFDEERHIFYNEKGDYLTSVTGATSVIDKSDILMAWAVKMMAQWLIEKWDIAKVHTEAEKLDIIGSAKKKYREISQRAADIGNEIHSWISEWIKGKNPDMPTDEKVVNGITAFLKFQKEHKIKWLETERVVYSKKHNYAGILDAVGKMGKDLVLFDFKSSNGVYTEMRFQVAGYQIAYEEETEKEFDRLMIIRFGKENGEFEAHDLGLHGKDRGAFINCLELRERLKELK